MLLAVVLLAAVALSVLVIVMTAAERDEDPVVAAADGPGLLARRDGGARARARFERAESLVLRGLGAGGSRGPREEPAPVAAGPGARPATGDAGTTTQPAPASSSAPLPAAVELPAVGRAVVARTAAGAPSRVDLTAVEGREPAEVDLRAPTAVPGLAEGSGEQGSAEQGTGGRVLAGAAGPAAEPARAGRRPQLPPMVHRVTERLVARVFDPFGSPEAADRPAATAGPASTAGRPTARATEGRAPLRPAGPQ